MANRRPITDTWFLTRAKLREGRRYYGAYPGGFLERARTLVGAAESDPVLHVCSGCVRWYPYSGFGPHDQTLDLDPALTPDYLQDATSPYPRPGEWRAILADPPYTEADAEYYVPGKERFPSLNRILLRALEAVMIGGCVGILHYLTPAPPRDIPCTYEASITVNTGFNNRVRVFSVFRRLPVAGPVDAGLFSKEECE